MPKDNFKRVKMKMLKIKEAKTTKKLLKNLSSKEVRKMSLVQPKIKSLLWKSREIFASKEHAHKSGKGMQVPENHI